MAHVTLKRVADGLYSFSNGSSAAPRTSTSHLHFLFKSGDGPADTIDLETSWSDSTGVYVGWYLISDTEITAAEAGAFVRSARMHLNLPNGNLRGLAWISQPAKWSETFVSIISKTPLPLGPGSQPGNVKRSGGISFTYPGGLGLSIQDNSTVTLVLTDTPRFRVEASIEFLKINWLGSPISAHAPVAGTGWTADVPLTGAKAGTVCFPMRYDEGSIYQLFGGCFRNFKSIDGQTATAFDYPLFTWTNVVPGTGGLIGLAAFMNPLFPDDAMQTRFALDLNGQPGTQPRTRAMEAPYYNAVDGQDLTFVTSPGDAPVPVAQDEPAVAFTAEAPGFALAKGPASDPKRAFEYYFTPVGQFTLKDTGSAVVKMICGFSGAEFINTAGTSATKLMLTTTHPCHVGSQMVQVPDGSWDAGNGTNVLNDQFTTSWSWVSGADQVPGSGGYFAQPVASAYYGGEVVTNSTYPYAVDAHINPLTTVSPYPIFPYGGIFSHNNAQAAQLHGVATTPATAQAYQDFENSVVATARHGVLTQAAKGPTFLEAASLAPVTAKTVSPQGLTVAPNSDGSWNTLTLAKGPVIASQALTFGPVTQPTGPATVDPAVSKVLMNAQLVWVVSDFAKLDDSAFQSEIDVGDFNFRLKPRDPAPDEAKSFMLFKFTKSVSVQEIMSNPATWTDAATWVDDVGAVQSAFQELVAKAEATVGRPQDPFIDFRNKILIDPSWTGILSFNTQIDANGMPADLQMLFAGIDGQLTAHHFGIQINRIAENEAVPDIKKSTLFGVIDFVGDCSGPGPQPPLTKTPATGGCCGLTDYSAYQFSVCDLIVVFANSVIADFHCQIKMNVAELFDREVALKDTPDNGIVINGKYQRHGAVGAVSFEVVKPFEFDTVTKDGALTRVIKKTVIGDASLVPVKKTDDADTLRDTPDDADTEDTATNTVRSRFKMSGGIYFAEDPFATDDDVDIFGFGSASGGLGFSELGLQICFELNAAGRREGKTVIAFDATAMRLASKQSSLREGALAAKLPIKLSGWLSSEDGLTKSDLGAHDVHVPQLADHACKAPHFALVYELPLGSLGGQSELHANLTAKLVMGWGPTATVPGNDGATVLVQLPEASAGYKGFNFQGVLKTVFGDANMMKVPYRDDFVWVMMFNNIQLSFFGIKLPPGVIINFVIFSDPAAPSSTNIAWYLAAAQKGDDGEGQDVVEGEPPKEMIDHE